MKERHVFGGGFTFVAILLIILSVSTFWPTIVCPQTYQMRQDAYDGGGTIWGFALLYFALYLVGVVCLFFGCLVKLNKRSSRPKFYSTCLQIAKDEAGMFAGAVFFLHVFFSVILIIAYSIFLSITSQGMTTEGFITVVAVGYICSIVVALRMFLGKIEADKYFQNTSSTKSLQSSIGEPLPSTENRHTSKKIEAPALNNNIEQYICPILRAKFVLIPAGTFMMGSPETEIDRRDDETLHQVTISKPFYLQTTTITQGQWSLVMGSNPSRNLSGTDKPVDTVSWENVQEYIRKLNQMVKGAFYRLPTEAEWEYACRAGSTKAFCFGDDDGLLSLDDNAWWYGNSGTDNHPVGLKKPNNWGLYDMHGNVREWLQDWYGNYTSNSVTDPVGPSSGTQRVIRGGCYASSRERCRSAARDQLYPRINCYPGKIGFRLALCANVNETA